MNWTKSLTSMIFIGINIIFEILGFTFIALGILFIFQSRTYHLSVNQLAIYSIALGFFILVISFLGWYGALKNKTRFLQWFIGIVTVIMLIQIGLRMNISWNTTNKQIIKKEIEKQLEHSFKNKQLADLIQRTFKCCGPINKDYWHGTVPESCHNPKTLTIYQTGCVKKIMKYVNTFLLSLELVGLGLLVIEGITVVLALVLIMMIERQREQERQPLIRRRIY